MEEGPHIIVSSIQKSGLDGKTALDILASSIDEASESNTSSLDNIGSKIEETASNILDSKLSRDTIASKIQGSNDELNLILKNLTENMLIVGSLLESSISMARKDSKEGLDTIASNLLATVTSLENQIKNIGDNIKTSLDVGGVTAKEGLDDIAISINDFKRELQSTGDVLRSSLD